MASTAEPSTPLKNAINPWISIIIIRSCIWIFGVSEHDARVCKHSFDYCNRDKTGILDLLPQFAASAEKHEGAPKAIKLTKLTERISI